MSGSLSKVRFGNPVEAPATTLRTFAGSAKAIVKKPVAVYIDKVYEEGDFAGLGIGT